MQIAKDIDISIPSKKEMSLALKSEQMLSDYIQSTNDPVFELVQQGKGNKKLLIPTAALHLLVSILSQMAKGNAVTLIPVHAELTTQEAADLLNVSRPYLVALLEDKQIPFRRVGARRRVLAKDILHYKDKIDNKRLEILEELANEAQKHNMGY